MTMHEKIKQKAPPRFSNNTGLSLPLAVWLAEEPYTDGSQNPEFIGKNVISATSLLKPVRSIILAADVSPSDRTDDIMDRVKSAVGRAVHSAVEQAWRGPHREQALRDLGLPQKLIDRMVVDADPNLASQYEEAEQFPVYMEQRQFRAVKVNVDGRIVEVIVSGQFDMIIDGEIDDTKVTSTFTYTSGNKVEDYQLQGSIYRWLNPQLVHGDVIRINHVFTDWQASRAASDSNYPPHPVHTSEYPLLSLAETEAWIKRRIRLIVENQNLSQDQMIRCTDDELWRSKPVYKYYTDPQKAHTGGRSTRNFDTLGEANAFQAQKGKGVVVQHPGEVRACKYCPALPVCDQARQLGF